ncbi:MAG TPA: bifunctional 3-(3-hydroxy-phenyl)propionate/3-hydroxycinnamic acid hydroxylase, partial [Frankiaceae bacterium]|nr:bifunctional 3-(3-hydroxy-phenyl)propionate/3-hydroxycinnamic acid hydroxylase [Frankiaceae bacterium]
MRDEVDVLVVGMGPVGAVLAGLLGRHGVDTLAVERDAGPYPLPRAVACDDEVLRVLAGLPGGGDVLTHVNGHQRAAFVDAGGRRLVEVDFGETELGLAGLAFFHQPTLERVLRAGLATLPSVRARLGHALTGLRQDADGAVASLRGPHGVTGEVRAGWLVGCDGAASGVRRAVDVAFTGRTLPSRWLVVDVATDSPLADRPYFTYTCDPARPAVDMPMPGGHRFEWAVLPGEREEDLVAPATVRALLGCRVDPDRVQVVRACVYAFHARVARRWRVGRVLLAGDAAHCMPPFAGQGLGAGVRDAANLSWKLAAVARGEAGARLLDSYERERRPHLATMTRLSRVVGAVLDARDPTVVAVRDRVLPAAAAAPGLG